MALTSTNQAFFLDYKGLVAFPIPKDSLAGGGWPSPELKRRSLGNCREGRRKYARPSVRHIIDHWCSTHARLVFRRNMREMYLVISLFLICRRSRSAGISPCLSVSVQYKAIVGPPEVRLGKWRFLSAVLPFRNASFIAYSTRT